MSDDLEKRLANHTYQTDKVILVPYLDNRKVFPDDFLAQLYGQMLKDGTLETVFAGMSDVTLNKFVSYLSKHPVVVYVLKPGDVVGFGWVAQAEGCDGARKASFGFTFYRKYWGTQLVRDLCWFSLRWWFEELKIDILYATSLKTNHMATNFARTFGFQKIGHLPMFFQKGDRLVDGTLICLKKSEFDPLYQSWHESQQSPKDTGVETLAVLT